MNPQKIVIVIDHNGPTVPFDAFLKVVKNTVSLLRGVDRKLEEEPSLSADWNISAASMQSPLHMTVLGTPVKEDVPPRDIVRSVLEDIALLERGETPKHFTPHQQDLVTEIVSVLGPRIRGLRFVGDGLEVQPTERVAVRVRELKDAYVDIGSVEGHLDLINVHGQEKVEVWDVRFGCGIACQISQRQIEEAKNLLGQRVSIKGRIRHERKRPVEVVEVFEIRRLEYPGGLPQIEDLLPINLSGEQEPADYLRGAD